jgi:hypothetical protein
MSEETIQPDEYFYKDLIDVYCVENGQKIATEIWAADIEINNINILDYCHNNLINSSDKIITHVLEVEDQRKVFYTTIFFNVCRRMGFAISTSDFPEKYYESLY